MKIQILFLSSIFLFTSCEHEAKNSSKSKITTDHELITETFQTQSLKKEPDEIAPDGSNIFLLPRVNGGSMCVCELPAGETTQAVKHKTIEEIWFFLSGNGEVWRRMGKMEEVTPVSKNISITIPSGCEFQFRNMGEDPLRFIIVTMPPWPGAQESTNVKNHWKRN